MTSCRFDNTIDHESTHFTQYHGRIDANDLSTLADAFTRIEQQRQKGNWIVLMLSYELGYLLEPRSRSGSAWPRTANDQRTPLLSALVFGQRNRVPELAPINVQRRSISSVQPSISRKEYERDIRKIKRWLMNGDVYQINHTFPLLVRSDQSPLSIYRNTLHSHPTRYAAYIDMGEEKILSFSPELFLNKSGPWLHTRPMKGTSPRHSDPTMDELSRHGLAASLKNRAENCMIVDLLRNDLGRIATPGSVTVDRLFEIERYESIWTMTSTIRAHVGDTSLANILTALFPCGSVTGAPKIAAMSRISELEPQPRGLYCGSIGWLAPNGDMQLNVAIRTLTMNGDEGVYGVGGGIVMDSDPSEEWQECQWKARVITTDTQSWQ